KIGPDPRNFNQRVSLGRNDLLIRTFPKSVSWHHYPVSAFITMFRKALGKSPTQYFSSLN
ncbi:hypothetical protein ACMAWB_26870, partial [Klebsiella pneumoniae]